jgi:hypothetical protein
LPTVEEGECESTTINVGQHPGPHADDEQSIAQFFANPTPEERKRRDFQERRVAHEDNRSWHLAKRMDRQHQRPLNPLHWLEGKSPQQNKDDRYITMSNNSKSERELHLGQLTSQLDNIKKYI